MAERQAVVLAQLICNLKNLRLSWLTKAMMTSAVIPIVLSACTIQGDFGRPQKSLLVQKAENALDDVGRVLAVGHPSFVLSDDEVELRKASSRFRQPLPSPYFPKRLLHLIDDRRFGELTHYADYLTDAGYVHGDARAQKIAELIQADHSWLSRFRQAARRVVASDKARLGLLAQEVSVYSQDDRLSAHARIEENREIMLRTLLDLDKRLIAYGYAIKRTQLELPMARVAATDTSLGLLREMAVNLRVELGFADLSVSELIDYKVIPPLRQDSLE